MALSGNAATIAQFASSKGLSAAGVAGVLGTWQAESGLNPGITNSIGAHGLAQWLAGRRTQLQQLAHNMGSTENSIAVQLEFWWQEMQQPQYAGLLHTLRTTNDPRAAATAMVTIYERPGPGGDPGAPGFAATFFSGGVPGGSGNPNAGGGTPQGSGSAQGQNVGLGHWLSEHSPFGDLFGMPRLEALPGTPAGAIAGFATNIGTLINAVLSLFRPSFWVRVGAFFFGLMLLGGGFIMLKGSIA